MIVAKATEGQKPSIVLLSTVKICNLIVCL